MVTNPRSRRGFTLLEIIVAVIIFGVVLSLVASLTRRAIDQRRLLDTRRAALLEVANALEILEANPAAGPQPGSEKQLTIPDILADKLDQPQFTARATQLEAKPATIRLDVEFTWTTEQHRPAAPIILSTIVFDEGASGRGGAETGDQE